MKNGTWMLAGLGLLGLTVLAVVPMGALYRLALAVMIAVCGMAVWTLQKRMAELAAEEKRQQENLLAQQKMLHMINHLRHDWMNDIQVLLGYIQLKKYDHLHAVMSNIMGKLQDESHLAKLGDPALIVFLLSCRTGAKHMQLEVELEKEVNLRQLNLNSEAVCRLIPELIEGFKQASAGENEEGSVLNMQIVSEEDSLLLDFVYQGVYARQELQAALEHVVRSGAGRSVSAVVEQSDYQEQEAAFALRLPYQTSVEV
ncbi:Spo0B domain-containing protein [Paenibacillus lutrae]|uniref:SpoOB alpha-helical domain-containing protein n=1 Tax=Paenibacillus lutrae TaxID=2078573 RepID=A0A7X3FH34_9BACL|nr:Spo0B domain-containing protein [Paenibacillus lutrae]MVO99670.1 hypothetical protein [Paenibacillus lutrae]